MHYAQRTFVIWGAIMVTLYLLTYTARATPRQQPSSGGELTVVDIYHSDDPQHPGAGVVSVEETQQPGTEVQEPATQGQSAPAGRPRQCDVYATRPVLNTIARASATIAGTESLAEPALTGDEMQPGTTYYRECRFADDGSLDAIDEFVYQPGESATAVATPPSAEVIARQAYAEVPLVLPAPHTSPGIDATQLVGFPIWLWVDGTVWRSFDASASVSGIAVTVVAEPDHTIWNMGDGTTITCAGPGTPWRPDGPDDQQTDCSHVYQFVSDDQPNGRYAASVTVVWSVSWSATTGESGTLPDASRTTGFSLDVAQRQAVITYGGG
jgi:hypothetical protein